MSYAWAVTLYGSPVRRESRSASSAAPAAKWACRCSSPRSIARRAGPASTRSGRTHSSRRQRRRAARSPAQAAGRCAASHARSRSPRAAPAPIGSTSTSPGASGFGFGAGRALSTRTSWPRRRSAWHSLTTNVSDSSGHWSRTKTIRIRGIIAGTARPRPRQPPGLAIRPSPTVDSLPGVAPPAVTPSGVRDGDPAALAGLCQARGPAVLAYSRNVAGDTAAPAAAAEAFATFRAAVHAAEDPAAINPEALLLNATRQAAARHAAVVAQGICAAVPRLLASRADRTITL